MTEDINQNFDQGVQDQAAAPEIFDEDFGKMKMELFKAKCRDILQPAALVREEEPRENSAINEQDEYQAVDQESQGSKTTEQVDIVTAYKGLKLAMSKNMKGLGEIPAQ